MTANVWPLFSSGADAAPGSFPPAGLTVGRVGLTAPVTGVTSWSQSGNDVSIAGQFVVTNQVHAETLRQQISAYAAGVDEDVVPVTWAEDPSVDGFYRVTAASFSSRASSLHSHLWDYRIDLERVRSGWRLAGMESIVSASWSANAAGRASEHAKPWVAVPGSATDLTRDVTTRLHCADTTEGVSLIDIAEVVPPLSTRWAVTAAGYYQGSARLFERDRLVVGPQLDAASTDSWTVSNGVLEVRLADDTLTDPAEGHIAVRRRLAAGWSAWKGFVIDTVGAPAGWTPSLRWASGLRVLRNEPSEVIVRLVALTRPHDPANTAQRVTVDIGLRRGATMARVVARAERPAQWSIARSNTEASTAGYAASGPVADEGILAAAADDADGCRFVIVSPATFDTVDETNGSVIFADAGGTTATLSVGLLGPVIGTAVTEDADRAADRALTAQGERVQAIAW